MVTWLTRDYPDGLDLPWHHAKSIPYWITLIVLMCLSTYAQVGYRVAIGVHHAPSAACCHHAPRATSNYTVPTTHLSSQPQLKFSGPRRDFDDIFQEKWSTTDDFEITDNNETFMPPRCV